MVKLFRFFLTKMRNECTLKNVWSREEAKLHDQGFPENYRAYRHKGKVVYSDDLDELTEEEKRILQATLIDMDWRHRWRNTG